MSKKRFSGNLPFASRRIFECELQVNENWIEYCCHTSRLLLCFDRWIFLRLNFMILTILTWSGWVRDIALFVFLNMWPQCFKFRIKLIICSTWLKDPQLPVENLKLLMCWNKILETLGKIIVSNSFLKVQCLYRIVSEFISNFPH